MKEFFVYNGLRLLLLASWIVIVFGIWFVVAPEGMTANQMLLAAIFAIIGSGVSSWYLLARQREALARRIQGSAEKAASKYEDARKGSNER